MLKGVNRNVIVVKADRDSRFETAYFVLRPHRLGEGESGAVTEAKRFLREGDARGGGYAKKGRVLRALLCFAAGAICGAGAVILTDFLL